MKVEKTTTITITEEERNTLMLAADILHGMVRANWEMVNYIDSETGEVLTDDDAMTKACEALDALYTCFAPINTKPYSD